MRQKKFEEDLVYVIRRLFLRKPEILVTYFFELYAKRV